MSDHTLWPAGHYRKKPVVIEAYRFDNRLWNHPPHWLMQALETGEVVHHDKPDQHLIINTLEGAMRANLDDWIIKGVVGEIYPCKPDVFAATYELADSGYLHIDDSANDAAADEFFGRSEDAR